MDAPKRSVQLIDSLKEIGFENKNFKKLHHMHISMQTHRKYCLEDVRVHQNDRTNERVRDRLEIVYGLFEAQKLTKNDPQVFDKLVELALIEHPL